MRARWSFWLPILFLAVAACGPGELTEGEKRPGLVKVGMSSKQVEALVGRSEETCWEYDRGEGANEKACFRDGIVSVYGKTYRIPGSKNFYVNALFADSWPPKPPPAFATTVSLGMPLSQVARLLGHPPVIVERYRVQEGYWGTYVDGKLTAFKPIPAPPVH